MIKNRIKEYRARFNMKQEDLAARVGVRRETIGNLEKGRYNPSLVLAWNIAQVFGVTIEEIFTVENDDGAEEKHIIFHQKGVPTGRLFSVVPRFLFLRAKARYTIIKKYRHKPLQGGTLCCASTRSIWRRGNRKCCCRNGRRAGCT